MFIVPEIYYTTKLMRILLSYTLKHCLHLNLGKKKRTDSITRLALHLCKSFVLSKLLICTLKKKTKTTQQKLWLHHKYEHDWILWQLWTWLFFHDTLITEWFFYFSFLNTDTKWNSLGNSYKTVNQNICKFVEA